MTRQTLLAAWGLATTVGWLATHWIGTTETAVLGLGIAGTVIAAWAVLMAVPLGLTWAARPVGLHGGGWAALVALGLAENAAVSAVGGEHDHSAHGPSGDGHAAATASGGERSDNGHDGGGHPTASESGDAPATESGHLHADASAHAHDAPPESPSPADTASANNGPADPGGAAAAPTGDSDAALVSPEAQHLSYYHLWFAIGAVGFALSAVQAEGGARKALYGTAAVLNAAMVGALVLYPPVEGVAFLVAAAIQGLPMLADLPLRRHVHAPAR